MGLIVSADSERYSGIWNNLENSTLRGTENYPKTTTDAYDVISHNKKITPPCQVNAPPAEVKFAQSSNTDNNKKVPGNNGI